MTQIKWTRDTVYQNLGRNRYSRPSGINIQMLDGCIGDYTKGEKASEIHLEAINARGDINTGIRLILPVEQVEEFITALRAEVEREKNRLASMAKLQERGKLSADVVSRSLGTTVQIAPQTEEAAAWIKEHLPAAPDGQGRFVPTMVDHSYAPDIILGMIQSGLAVWDHDTCLLAQSPV